tara:strand:- start:595 stop:1473 length:879 start_codon:yes stop_codon:yes gene_type:complete
MGREEPERYEWYRALRIPESVEQEWAREDFNEQVQRVLALTQCDDIASGHSSLIKLAHKLKQHDAVSQIVNVTHTVADRLTTPLSKLIVAENLNGRTEDQNDGAIYLAYQLGLHEFTQGLLDSALALVSGAESQHRLLERCDAARRNSQRLAIRFSLSSEAPLEKAGQAIVYLVDPEREQKLVDPPLNEVVAKIQSLEWKDGGSSVTLQRLPAGQLSIDRIIVEKNAASDIYSGQGRFEVCWCHAVFGYSFIRVWIDSLDLVCEILGAALDNDEARLRATADWDLPLWLKMD